MAILLGRSLKEAIGPTVKMLEPGWPQRTFGIRQPNGAPLNARCLLNSSPYKQLPGIWGNSLINHDVATSTHLNQKVTKLSSNFNPSVFTALAVLGFRFGVAVEGRFKCRTASFKERAMGCIEIKHHP